jgi:L-lactate dehydrogenase (cytochrome)
MKKSSIHCLEDARKLARKKLPEMIFDYIDGTALEGDGEESNFRSFKNIKLMQNTLSGVSKKKLKRKLWKYNFDLPFGIAPMGMCNLVNSKADRSIATLSNKFNIPVSFSTMASSSLETTLKITGDLGWFQLYVYDDLQSGLDLAKRAQDAGYKTIILTVDVPDLGRRPRELKHNFKAQFTPSIRQVLDCSLHPLWSFDLLTNGIPSPANFDKNLKIDRNKPRGSADWNFLKSLRDLWKGNLIIKGILNPIDAKKAEIFGVDAIYVSGHGSRQFDSSPVPIEQLPKIRSVLRKDTNVIFDTGIRNGEDIIKAICLGADFVMIGKPALFSLGAEGMTGLTQMTNNLKKEIEIGMSQMGVSDINLLNKSFIHRSN